MAEKNAQDAKRQPPSLIECGRFRLDVKACRLHKDGREKRLTPKETRLLATFMSNPDRTLTRKFLMKEVWDTDFLADTRTLDVHVHWIRKKIEDEPRHPVYIRTVRRVGYRFTIEETPT